MRKMEQRRKLKESIKVKEKKIQEAVDIGRGTEDYGWTPITGGAERDVTALTQKRMQDIAAYLYDANPIGHRIPEMMKDFVIGDGYTWEAPDKDVKAIIKSFWNDPLNDFDRRLDIRALELSIMGELIFKTFVAQQTGHVRLGYIDPGKVTKVVLDSDNPEIAKEVHWRKRQKNYGYKTDKLQVINYDLDPHRTGEATYERLAGNCFFFAINKVASASRGKSDLLSIADMIDAHDAFLFTRLERANLLNVFIWDILYEGGSKTEIEDFAKGIVMPKPGSVRVHNEKVTWKAVTPKLEAGDASREAKLFKDQILAGAGFPPHYFSSGEQTGRSTSESMNLPTLKMLRSRQRYFTKIIEFIIQYVIDQAIIAGYLKPTGKDLSFKINASPIQERITFSAYEMKQKRAAGTKIGDKPEDEESPEEETEKGGKDGEKEED